MRYDFKVIDSDTHFQAATESILPYLKGTAIESRIPEFEQERVPIRTGRAGQKLSEPFRHNFRFAGGGQGGGGWAGDDGPRILGTVGKASAEREFQQFMGSRYPTVGTEDHLVDTRIREMDEEGTDVHIMVANAVGANHPELEVARIFRDATHRFINDTCNKYPTRLKSMIQVSGGDVEGAIDEMKKWGDADWAVAVQVAMPRGMPTDHPDLEPIWQQAEELGVTVVHHSGASGYPGERDLWDNPFLGRLSSHPWGAMRFIASLIGAGVMDRHPNLRVAVLESGFGWIPFWGRRMDDQVHYMGYVNPDLKKTVWEHLTSGRFFASIVIHEGGDMVKAVNQLVGNEVLMFSSDYPHAESRFPDSVDISNSWGFDDATKQKMFWDNAARCFGLDENGHRLRLAQRVASA